LILAASFPDRYHYILKKSDDEKIPIRYAEQDEFHTTHAEVGAYLMGLWGLPDRIVEALAFHHRITECPGKRFAPLIAVHIANALEHESCQSNGTDYSGEIDLEHLATLGMDGKIERWKQLIN